MRKNISRYILACFIFLLFVFNYLFISTTFVKADIYPVTRGQGYNYTLYNPDFNQYFTVWGDCRNFQAPHTCGYGATNDSDIYGQIINSNGSCNGGNIHIAGGTLGQELPAFVYNPDKQEYLVVWQSLAVDYQAGANPEGEFQNTGFDIFGQRISAANGQKIGDSFKITPSADLTPLGICYNHANAGKPCDDSQWHPRIAYSTRSKRYMVVWHDGRTRARNFGPNGVYHPDSSDGTTFKDIYGQILDENGNLIGNNFPVSIDPDNQSKIEKGNAKRIQQYAEITYDNLNDRFLVVWEDDRLHETVNPHPPGQRYDCLNLDIFGGFFSPDGMPLGNNFPISTDNKAERYPRVTYNPIVNEFFVIWQALPRYSSCPSGNYPAGASDFRQVFAQRINSSNQLEGDLIVVDNQVQLHDHYGEDTEPPRAGVLVNNTNGQYLVTWERPNILYGCWLTSGSQSCNKFQISGGVKDGYVSFNQNSQQYFYSFLQWSSGISRVVYKSQNISDAFNCPQEGNPTICPTCPTITTQPSSIPSQQPTFPPTYLKAATIKFKAKTGSSGNVSIDFRALPDSKIYEKTTADDILGTVKKLDFIITGESSTGIPVVTLKIKFRGVTENKGVQVVKVSVYKEGAFKKEFSGVYAKFKDGTYVIENLKLLGIAPGKNYRLFVKGPKHLSHGFDLVELKDGNNIFDYTNEELEAGDLSPQDGVINSLDISRLLELLTVDNPSKEQLMIGDLNFDGVINGADINEMLLSL